MIVDSHIHLYDPGRPEGIPWPKPDDQIYRTVLPVDFRVVAATTEVTHAVIVEASPWLEDNQWILDIIEDDSTILGFVGNLDLGSGEFPGRLERFADNPLFCGIRARSVEGLLTYRDNLEELARAGLSLDVLARGDGLESIARVADAVPSLRIVVDHLGHPPIDGGEPDRGWQKAMQLCSEKPNIFCKVSRVTEAATEWPASTNPDFYRPVLEHLWRCFGSGRLLWGSNWPVAEKAGDYATTLDLVTAFLNGFSSEEAEAVLWKTSQEAYRWRSRAD